MAIFLFRPEKPKRIKYTLEWNLLEKSVKRPFVVLFPYAGVLHIFMLYNVLVSGISFYRKSKIIVKR